VVHLLGEVARLAAERDRTEVGVDGPRVHQDPRVEEVVRVEDCLHLGEETESGR
jgi:hypothetical protein